MSLAQSLVSRIAAHAAPDAARLVYSALSPLHEKGAHQLAALPPRCREDWAGRPVFYDSSGGWLRPRLRERLCARVQMLAVGPPRSESSARFDAVKFVAELVFGSRLDCAFIEHLGFGESSSLKDRWSSCSRLLSSTSGSESRRSSGTGVVVMTHDWWHVHPSAPLWTFAASLHACPEQGKCGSCALASIFPSVLASHRAQVSRRDVDSPAWHCPCG